MYNKDALTFKSSDSGQSEDNKANQEDDFSGSGKVEDRGVDLFARLNLAMEKIEELEIQLDDMQKVRENDQRCEAEARKEMWSLIRPLQKMTPKMQPRAEFLRALLIANGGQMLATYARKKMGLSRSRFSELLGKMKGEVETKQYHRQKSWKVLILKRGHDTM